KTLDGNPITHVGLYLKNGYFINSASKGVTIANLRSAYWASKYVSCGRINLTRSTRIRNVSKN
ncbi:MAG TPA: NlpC/P60 family protein, partial [Niabella sp.]